MKIYETAELRGMITTLLQARLTWGQAEAYATDVTDWMRRNDLVVVRKAELDLATDDVRAYVRNETCVSCGGKVRDYHCGNCGTSYEEYRDI